VTRLWNSFKADVDPIERAETCDECLRGLKRTEKRLTRELEIVEELNAIHQFEGPWHLVSSSWIARWKEYLRPSVSQLDGIQPPGPIDNSMLLTKDGLPRPNLMKTTHYRAVNRHVWAALHMLYGGGPAVRRNRIDLYAAAVTEVSCSTSDLTPMLMEELNKLKSLGSLLLSSVEVAL
jgi:hypothetical protein